MPLWLRFAVFLSICAAILDDLGLAAALRGMFDRQAQRGGIALEFSNETSGTRAPILLETTCFRVAQEALTNVLKHARARRVSVRILELHGELHLHIEDDGVGFDVEQARRRAQPEAAAWGC